VENTDRAQANRRKRRDAKP